MPDRSYRRTDSHNADDLPSEPVEVHDEHAVVEDDEHVATDHRVAAVSPRRVDRTVVDDSLVTERRVGTHYYESLPARVNTILFAVVLALEGLLALRFTLVAFGASRTSGFVDFIMDVSWPFVRPFSNAFSNRTWDQGIVEVNTLLAMGVWLLGFLLLAMLINAVLPRYDETGSRVRRERVTHS